MHVSINKLPRALTQIMRKNLEKNAPGAIEITVRDVKIDEQPRIEFKMNSRESELWFEIPCLLMRPGKALMSPAGLDWIDSLDKNSPDPITLHIDGNDRLVMKSKKSTTRLKKDSLYFDEMRSHGDIGNLRVIEVLRSTAENIVASCSRFTGDPVREILNYICIQEWKEADNAPEKIVALAANGYCLSKVVVETVSYEPGFGEILISPSVLDMAVKLCEIFEDTVLRIGTTENTVILSGDKWYLKAIKAGKRYLNVQNVIDIANRNRTGEVLVNSAQILSALTISEIFARDMDFSVRITQDKENEMIIAGRSPERGDAETTFPCSTELPTHFPTSFVNSRYLKAGVSTFPCEEVLLTVNEQGIFTVRDVNRPENLVVIMGMEK